MNNDYKKLQNNGSKDVRCNTHRKNRKFAHGTAREHIEETLEVSAVKQLLNHASVYARNWDMCSSPKNDEHGESKKDFPPEFCYLRKICEG